MDDSLLVNIEMPLKWRQKLAYSIGHVFNDLCASMWFTYLLVYLHLVERFSNSYAGILLLVGQIADGLSTPFVGLELDKVDNFILCRYGRKKSWHLAGTFCVLISFPFIFMQCLGCENSSKWAQLIYYSGFVIIFQFGWASVQISHLSLIPDLTEDEHERTELTALRYAFTVISNISVYGITWLILGVTGQETESAQIGPEDLFKFRNIVLIVVAIGIFKSIIFHLGVKENKDVPSILASENGQIINGENGKFRKRMTWRNWLKETSFYQVAVLYMFTRLFVNLVQVYIPLYLQDTMQLPETSIAIFPLVMYVSGFVSSFLMKFLNRCCGRKITYSIGALMGIGACIWIYFGNGDDYTRIELYFVTVMFGIACSTVLITSLSITADLIGSNVESSAFVYGAMSFTDKLSNGAAVMIIQYMAPCQISSCINHTNYFKLILTFICGGAAVISLITVWTLRFGQMINRRLNRNQLITNDESDDPLLID